MALQSHAEPSRFLGRASRISERHNRHLLLTISSSLIQHSVRRENRRPLHYPNFLTSRRFWCAGPAALAGVQRLLDLLQWVTLLDKFFGLWNCSLYADLGCHLAQSTGVQARVPCLPFRRRNRAQNPSRHCVPCWRSFPRRASCRRQVQG